MLTTGPSGNDGMRLHEFRRVLVVACISILSVGEVLSAVFVFVVIAPLFVDLMIITQLLLLSILLFLPAATCFIGSL